MTMKKLADEIAAAAKAEADEIIKKANDEAAEIIAAAQSEADGITSGNAVKSKREADKLGLELVASAKQANQKLQLIARREELDSTYESLKDQVGSASLKGRSALLKKLLAKATAEAGKDMILRPVAMDRKALAAETSYKLGDDIEGLGGFTLESKDSSVSLDFRFDGMLESAWNDLLGQVSDALFG